MAATGPADEEIFRDAAAESGWGEPGYSSYERLTLRPALTINGFVGGYQGPGAKAVIPAKAAAKLNFRLVPDQDPREIETLFRQHIARITPPTVRSEVRASASAKPRARQPATSSSTGGSQSLSKGFRPAACVPEIGRHDSDCKHASGGASDSHSLDGLCIARRQPACAQREVSPAHLFQCHQDFH